MVESAEEAGEAELQEELRRLQQEHADVCSRSDEARSNYEQAIAAKDDAIAQLQTALQRIEARHLPSLRPVSCFPLFSPAL
jgi:uncharacterized protein (DUF3084 family)